MEVKNHRSFKSVGSSRQLLEKVTLPYKHRQLSSTAEFNGMIKGNSLTGKEDAETIFNHKVHSTLHLLKLQVRFVLSSRLDLSQPF